MKPLELGKIVIESLVVYQFFMLPLFGQSSVVEDKQAVGVLQGRQAVRNENCGALFCPPPDGVANCPLGLRIDARRGLIQDQDGRVEQQRTGNG